MSTQNHVSDQPPVLSAEASSECCEKFRVCSEIRVQPIARSMVSVLAMESRDMGSQSLESSQVFWSAARNCRHFLLFHFTVCLQLVMSMPAQNAGEREGVRPQGEPPPPYGHSTAALCYRYQSLALPSSMDEKIPGNDGLEEKPRRRFATRRA